MTANAGTADTGTVDTGMAVSPEQTLRRLFLTLFLRGRAGRGLNKVGAPQTIGRKLALVLFFYALFGAMALAFVTQTVFVLSTYLHAMTFVFIGMFVATSSGEVLFNKEEGDILLHRPVAPRALLWAKVAVLVQVALWLALAFNLVGLIVGVWASDGGWSFPLAHLLSTSLEALFCTATVVMVYQLCLRWFGRERLDAFMTATQVLVSIVVVVGGQLVPQLMIRNRGLTLISVTKWWVMFLPPAWFAGIDDALAGSHAARSWGLAALGVAATATVLYLAFNKLAQNYHEGLQAIAESGTQRPARARRQWLQRLVRIPPLSWWLREPVSRASFLLASAYLLRDREIKLRVYPGIAPMLVLPVIMLLPVADRSMRAGAFSIAFAGSYVGMVPLLTLGMLEFSQQWAASDVFRLAPISGPAALNDGARRAVLLLIAAPMVVLFATIIVLVIGRNAPLELMLPGVIALPLYAMIPGIGGGSLLLSRAPDEGKAAGRNLKTLIALPISMALAGITAFAHGRGWLAYVLIAELVIVAIVYVIMRIAASKAPWKPLV